ncbi:MAG TPA: LysR family transcriptional regulator [Steroidobacteraceae bacterium]|nr:LysR family transcriptional regulator [Steroidobacteraceae bacterium]
MDLNLLVALDALLADKSVTRAAAKLNITQPAMSGALARLRDYFEDPLVIQVGRQLELTPLASSLVAPVHDIILRIDSAISIEPAFEAAQSKRHFTITVSDYVIRVFLLDVLGRLQREAPGISFEFRQSSGRVKEELEAGEVDFVIGPEIDLLSEHPHELLFEDTYAVVAWTGNSLVGDSLTLDEYLGLGHVVFRSEHHGNPWLERWFTSRYGEVRRVELAAPSFSLLPHLVVGTNRIATMQMRLARLYMLTLPIKMVPAPLEVPKLVEILQWNVHRDMDPASRWLRATLKAHAALLDPA